MEYIELAPINAADLNEMYGYRLARVRQQMQRREVELCVLASPISLRYAINFTEYQVFQAHIPTAYLFLPLEGDVTLFGASQRHYPGVDHYGASRFVTPFDGGVELIENCRAFVHDLMLYVQQQGIDARRIALERLSPLITQQLATKGITVNDAECLVEHAKLIKHGTELRCIEQSIQVAEYGIGQMHQALEPGITESQLWSILHQVNIAHGGGWIEGHMLASGPRTNPWLQEVSQRTIQAGELVAFDTDMVGPHGYLADISRTWVCGGGRGNAEQRSAYQHAYDEIHHNMQLIQPGVGFNELIDGIYPRQRKYIDKRYVCAFHGAGLCDEYPKIYYPEDRRHNRYDDVFQENMVLCIESYSGADNGWEGVKLEQMVRVTAQGYELLSHYPFETALLNP